MKLIGLFPGQGSQSVGMGKDFAENIDIAREIFEQADKALGYALSKLCQEGPIEELTLTQNAQPAILCASYISYQIADIELSAAAGHSLGEYSALVAAGTLSFEDAVVAVHKRGQYMQEAVAPGEGKMLAVMGPSEEEISSVIATVESGIVEVANLNSPGQTVVAGEASAIDDFAEKMKAAGGKVIPLNVSAPFHCSLMKPAAEKLASDLKAISFSDPKFPVYSNVSAQAISSGDEARNLLIEQVCSSVRWTESMQNLISKEQATHSAEFGPGGVLTKLLKRIDKSLGRVEVFDRESLEKARATLAS